MRGSTGRGIAAPAGSPADRPPLTGDAAMFHLTITVDHVLDFVTTPSAEASAAGWLEVPWLSGSRMQVERGVFNLFVDEGDPTSKRMLYRPG